MEEKKPKGRLYCFLKGLLAENPTLVLVLGTCPTIAKTDCVFNALGLGLCTALVLIFSNMAISALRRVIPDKVRIPVFIVVIASFVTILQMVMQAFVPAIYATLGLYIPLIVVNCLILGRAEAFACSHNAGESLLDGVGMGLGFSLALTVLGAVREILGAGSIFGFVLLPETSNMLLFVLPPGAFITVGYLIAIVNRFKKA